MGVLSREQLLVPRALPRQTVSCPGLGGDVLVQGLTGAQRDAWEASLVQGKGKHRDVNMVNVRAKLVALSVIGDDGALVFGPADVGAIGALPAADVDRIFAVAKKLSGISEEDADELGQPSDDTRPAP